MNEPARALSPHRRDAALQRLRTITTGTALAGIVGTGAFGALAAITYSGSPAATTDGTSGQDVQPEERNEAAGQLDDDSGQAFVPVQPPTTSRSSRRAHISSGSS